MLLEALIAVLISTIVGAGTAYLTSRMALSAKDQRLEGIATQQMRELLQQYGATLCQGQPNQGKAVVLAPDGSQSKLQVVCTAGSTAILNGVSVQGTTLVMLCSTSDPSGNNAMPSLAVGSGDPQACDKQS